MSKDNKVSYVEAAKDYDKHRSYSESEIREIIEFAGIKKGARVLDLGCGTGNITRGLLKCIDIDVVGIDVAIPMLTVARGKSLEVVCADAARYRLPFRDNTFDTIVGGFVIHQIGNLESLFPECYRVLHQGSVAFFTSSHRQIENYHPVIKRFFPSLIEIDKARFPDLPEIEHLLTAAGFKDISHREITARKIPIDITFLEKVKGKFISTYQLVPEREFELGVAGLEEYIKNLKQPENREWRGTLIGGRKDK